MIKVALLGCKSGAIATQIGFLLLLFFAHFPHKPSNSLYINVYPCTLKIQEFRTKDFLVRSAHSIEHQKCKYCVGRQGVRIRSFEL